METIFFIKNAWVIPLAPLIGFLINGFGSFLGFGYAKYRKFVNVIACGAMLVSFVFAVGIFWELLGLPPEERSLTLNIYNWISIGSLKADVAFLLDPLSCVMMLVVTGVGFLIHVYSTGYMHDDPGYARYFSYLNLFAFAMLLLVMGDNLLLMFIGWEGVGLCSYLLIGFWFDHKPNAIAGMKAFIVNRIGDFGFLIGVIFLFWYLHQTGHATVVFSEIKEHIHLLQGMEAAGISALALIGILLFVGAMGKSAQIPLYVWLPDAMAGPTPVSALIHAATMVTAGVYMIGRLNFLYTLAPEALIVVATVGAVTALFAATIGFAQNDIKKVLAYSTVSQLGYMFLGMGTGAYAAGIFHLMTHAFFKACLFLGAGSVILGCHHEQDMRKMGGLRKYMPVTFISFLLATIAIIGIFPFAGFFSKDEILWRVFERGGHQSWFYLLWGIGILGVIGTAFYMFRALSMTFFGKYGERVSWISKEDLEHEEHEEHGEEDSRMPHEPPKSMDFAVVILGILSVIGGLVGVPYALGHFVDLPNFFESWLHPVFASAGHGSEVHHEVPVTEYLLMGLSVAIALIAVGVAYYMYNKRKELPGRFIARFPRLFRLVFHKYFVDEIYQRFIVNNLLRLNAFLRGFDDKIIDGLVNLVGAIGRAFSRVSGFTDSTFVDGLVNLTGNTVRFAGAQIRKIQTGRIQNYLYVAIAGVVVLMIWKLF